MILSGQEHHHLVHLLHTLASSSAPDDRIIVPISNKIQKIMQQDFLVQIILGPKKNRSKKFGTKHNLQIKKDLAQKVEVQN